MSKNYCLCSRKQAPGSEPSAQSLMRGSNPWTARLLPGWSWTFNRLRHPGAPECTFFYAIDGHSLQSAFEFHIISYISPHYEIFLFKFLFNFYLFLRERRRESMSRGGAESEGDTESKAGSRLWAVSTEPDTGLELTNCEIMTWAEVRCSTDWATQMPQHFLIMKYF